MHHTKINAPTKQHNRNKLDINKPDVLPIDRFVESIPVNVSMVLSPAKAICTGNSSMLIPAAAVV